MARFQSIRTGARNQLNVRALVWAVLLAVAAGAMAASPLLGLLGFESSLVLATAVSFAAAHLGAGAVWRARAAQTPSEGERRDAFPGGAVARIYIQAVSRSLLILGLNAYRIKNCDFGMGLAWYAILPCVSAATGTAAGIWAGFCTKRRI